MKMGSFLKHCPSLKVYICYTNLYFMEEFDIRADKNRNRLYCILKGFFLESEIDLALDKISVELLNLSAGYDVILDIQGLKTSPDYMKRIFYEKLIQFTRSGCRYLFCVDPGKIANAVKKFGRSTLYHHQKIRLVSYMNDAEDFLEKDSLLKNLFYN